MPASETASNGDEENLDLDNMFPEDERPATPPPTFATYERPSNKGLLTIRLVSQHPLWAHHLWNASKVFCDYLAANPQFVQGKNVLELGAGGGLPSVVCALEGARKVVVTDYPDEVLLENIRWNVRHAGVQSAEGEEKGQSVVVAGHLWGKDPAPILQSLDGQEPRFDLLILSDLIFNHSQHLTLLISCERTISPTGVALVFHSHHLPQFAERDLGFFRLAKERGWEVVEVVRETKYGVMFEEDKGDRSLRGTVWGWAMRWRNGGKDGNDGNDGGEERRVG